jgi:hypothetical protein
LTALLVALGGVAGVLSSADAFGGRDAWALLAAAAPALATALAAYDALFGFERNAEIFADASAALRLAELRAPAQSNDPDRIRAWVEQVAGTSSVSRGNGGSSRRTPSHSRNSVPPAPKDGGKPGCWPRGPLEATCGLAVLLGAG